MLFSIRKAQGQALHNTNFTQRKNIFQNNKTYLIYKKKYKHSIYKVQLFEKIET